MRDESDTTLGATDESDEATRQSRTTCGNTRRTFLGGALGSALAAGVGAIGAAAGQVTADQFTVACDYIELTDASGLDSVRVDFRDGSFVSSVNGVTLDDGHPITLGSPGRIVKSVTLNSEETFDGFDTCEPQRRRRTTFTATAVHVPPAEFIMNGFVPSSLNSAVSLSFTDGTSEIAQGYVSEGTLDDFPEFDGILTVEGVGGVTNRYRGTGANAGKVIEAIRIETDTDYRRFHLVSDVAEAALLGTESQQERPIEIVGASQGAVEYELTATGPIRPLQVNDRIGAGSNDAISQNDDGTWTVSGYTGNTGYGDAYVVNGEITELTQTGGDGDYVVRELERRVVDSDEAGDRGGTIDGDASDETSDGSTSHELAVIATEQGEVTYEFTVDGSVERATGVDSDRIAEENDTIRDNGDGTVTVSGYTGNAGYGDTYLVIGDLLSFERTGGDAAYRVEVDGSMVSPGAVADLL